MSPPGGRWLDRIERIGNALPHPATLFLLGALAVMALSQVAAVRGWTVEKTVSREVTEAVLDVNGDTVVDSSDIASLATYLFIGGPPPAQGIECFVTVESCAPGCDRLCWSAALRHGSPRNARTFSTTAC